MWPSFLKSNGRFARPSQRCSLCHDLAEDLHLCGDCLHLLTSLKMPQAVCPYCAHDSTDGAVCGVCQLQMPHFDRLWASYRLGFPLHQMVLEYKFQQQWSYAPVLADWMCAHAPVWLPEMGFDGVLAMPLSRGRLLERGYNQSECLAQAIAKHFSLISLSAHQLKLQRAYRPPQTSLGVKFRYQNVDGVFSIQNDVNKRHLLLIDDVVTTCATLNELARILKQAGVSSVSCWVLARA